MSVLDECLVLFLCPSYKLFKVAAQGTQLTVKVKVMSAEWNMILLHEMSVQAATSS